MNSARRMTKSMKSTRSPILLLAKTSPSSASLPHQNLSRAELVIIVADLSGTVLLSLEF
jgi:hypothetical protein